MDQGKTPITLKLRLSLVRKHVILVMQHVILVMLHVVPVMHRETGGSKKVCSSEESIIRNTELVHLFLWDFNCSCGGVVTLRCELEL